MTQFVARSVTAYDGPFPYVDGLIMQVTQRIGEIEVEHLPRMVGRSNYTVRRLVRLWLNLFVNFSVMPLRISTLTGFALSILGLFGFAMVVGEALFSATPPGWASIAAAVLLLSGVQLLILGLLGEYIGRLYLTQNRKPQAIVREIVRSPPKPERTAQPALAIRKA